MIYLTDFVTTRLTLILAVLISLQGCAVLPAPGEEDVFIDTEQIATVRAGQTDRTDLQNRFGPPDWSNSDGSQWIYHTRDYRPAGIGVLSEWGAGSLMNWRAEFLYVSFNGSSIVDTVEVSGVEPDPVDGWSKREITNGCVEAYAMPLLYGSANEDADGKRFLTEPDKCAVYLYTATTSLPFIVYFGYSSRCPANDGYLRFDLKPGVREVTVISDNKFERQKFSQTPVGERDFSGTIEFDCAPGDVLFMRQHFGGGDDFSFQIVPQEEGRRNIAARRLVILQKLRLRSSGDQSTH